MISPAQGHLGVVAWRPPTNMSAAQLAIAISTGLFLSMFACLEVGYRVGWRNTQKHPTAQEGIGAIEAAIFALLGLLLGFSFSGATTRWMPGAN